MTHTDTTSGLADDIGRQIETATTRQAAMEAAVATLKARLPHYTWVGIYLLYGNELVLGPFVGKPSPHTHIPVGRGICGAAAAEKATIVVDDVNADPRYLACSTETRSEIVPPTRTPNPSPPASRAVTCSPAPPRAAARRLRSCCRSSSACATGRAAARVR